MNEKKFEQIEKHLYRRQYQTASGDWSTVFYAVFKCWDGKRRWFPAGNNLKAAREVLTLRLADNMVTAPIIQQGVQVNLPQTQSSAIPGTEEHLVVTVAKNGKIYLNDNAMSLAELGEKLKAIKKLQADKQIYLRADQDVRYGLVMKTIAEIKQAGIEKLGMVTRPVSSEQG